MKTLLTQWCRLSGRMCAVFFALGWIFFVTVGLAADLQFAAVLKGQEFAQTSADIVALGEWNTWYRTGEVQNEGEHLEPVFMFEAIGIESLPGSLLAGSLTTPGAATLLLGRGEDQEDPELGIESGAASQLALEEAWPDGDYTLAFTGAADGTLTPVTLTLSGGLYPPVPQITNFSELQAVDAAASVAVEWSPMGGVATDFILLRIVAREGDSEGATIYQSALPGMPGALDGTMTQATIPAGVLDPGSDYQGEVIFFKTVDSETTSALYVAAYYKLTGFLIRTAGLAGEPLGSEWLRSNPRDGWEAVARDSAVAFHFSHPMDPGHISIGWTKDGGPLSTGTFSYHWTQGDTVLLCEFSQALPADSDIGWELNLPGFRDAAGFALAGNPSGHFRTATDDPATPPDIDMIVLLKTRSFRQTSSTPQADGRYEAIIEIESNAVNRLSAAAVTSLVGGRISPLYADPWSGDEYEAPGEYGSQADLDHFYPNGDYTFTLEGLADGVQGVTVSLGETDQYPAAPTITNLAELQVIDPAAATLVQWGALPGWSHDLTAGAGFIEFEIIDALDREVFWLEGSDITSSTECEIPAGTLRPGRAYQAYLYFVRITDSDTSAYPGAMAAAGFESSTYFTITTGGQVELPSVTLQRLGDAARINLSELDNATRYALEVSSDLVRWTPLTDIWSGTSGWDDADAHYLKSRFYRLRESGNAEDLTPCIAIQGTVWTDSGRTTPVAGAVVGTSLDQQSTITDAAGRFFLVTDTPSQNGTANYTVQVKQGAQSYSFGPYPWGDQPREQAFILE